MCDKFMQCAYITGTFLICQFPLMLPNLNDAILIKDFKLQKFNLPTSFHQ